MTINWRARDNDGAILAIPVKEIKRSGDIHYPAGKIKKTKRQQFGRAIKFRG